MRLQRVASAVAITLVLLLTTVPAPAAASTSPSATIVSPTDQERVPPLAKVRIHYAGYSAGASNISGYLMLDGVPAGSFSARTASGAANGTTFSATLNATGFASGAHALTARVLTELDNPVDTPPVTVVLDHPPAVTLLSASYDLDTRTLLVEADVTDDHGPSTVRLAAGSSNVTVTGVQGHVSLSLPTAPPPGTHVATLRATDAFSQSTLLRFAFVVGDRPAEAVVDAAYERGGKLRVTAQVADPDGGAKSVTVITPLGGGRLSLMNGTWEGTVPVAPRLGTFDGTLHSVDAYGGNTSTPFQFTIGGARETVFERIVETTAGGYADASLLALPPVLDARIEVVIEPFGTVDGAAPGGMGRTYYDILCAMPSPQCRALQGDPGEGAFRPCAPGAPAPLPAALLREGVRALDSASRAAIGRALVCHDQLREVNATLDERGWLTPHGALVVASATSGPPCVAPTSTTCAFDAPYGRTMDLSWAQGPDHRVSVRVSGVRV